MPQNGKTVFELFQNRIYFIPPNQREYSWEKINCKDLFDDINYIFQDDLAHLMGGLTFVKIEDKELTDEFANKYESYDVVDGQQRLTTILILLMSIYKHLRRQKSRIADDLVRRYIRTRNNDDTDYLYLLNPNQYCRDFFYKVVCNTEEITKTRTQLSQERKQISRTSHSRIIDAIQFFDAELDGISRSKTQESFSNYIIGLYQTITNRLVFSEIFVHSDMEAGIIFETMNNRGKPISEMDKVKNRLLYLGNKINPGSDTLPQKVGECWESVLNELMTSDLSATRFEDFLLRAHWFMAYDPNFKRWDGINTFKGWFDLSNSNDIVRDDEVKFCKKSKEDQYQDLCDYVDSLKESVTFFCDFMKPNSNSAFSGFDCTKEERVQLKHSAKRLSQIQMTEKFLPLLMACRKRFRFNELIDIVDLCEKFSFRAFVMCGIRQNSGRSRILNKANEVYRNLDDSEYRVIYTSVFDEICGLTTQLASDDKFNAELASETDFYHWNGITYFLFELEFFLRKKLGFPVEEIIYIDKKEKTIEHILPQEPENPSSVHRYWKTKIRDPSDRRSFCHRLGNLTLTPGGDNTALANYGFEEKRGQKSDPNASLEVSRKSGAVETDNPTYSRSKFLITWELSKYDAWNKTNLQKRERELIKLAKERWLVPSKFSVIIEDDDDDDDDD